MATRKQQPQPQGTDQVRREYACAVLTGIYASVGKQLLELGNHEYAHALTNARRVAFDQADEMLKEAA